MILMFKVVSKKLINAFRLVALAFEYKRNFT